jgi:hypothetical protein
VTSLNRKKPEFLGIIADAISALFKKAGFDVVDGKSAML